MGNTRVSFKDSSGHLVKTAETAFDPWGLKLTGVGSVNEFQNRWEMQGKEAEQTFGLNRVNFGARVYNPTIGRWDRVDNFSEAAPNLTGYRYSFNNPVNITDPDGNFEYSDGYSMNSSNNGSVSMTSFSGTYSTGRAEPEGQQDCPNPPCGAFERLFANPQTKEEANDYANMRGLDAAFSQYLKEVKEKFDSFFSIIPFGSVATGTLKAREGDVQGASIDMLLGGFDAAGGLIFKGIPKVLKAVNSNLPHAVTRSVERGIFASTEEASQVLKNLTKDISKSGFPKGSFADPSYLDRVLVPIGNNGLV